MDPVILSCGKVPGKSSSKNCWLIFSKKIVPAHAGEGRHQLDGEVMRFLKKSAKFVRNNRMPIGIDFVKH